MKKLITLFLSLLCTLTLAMGLTACKAREDFNIDTTNYTSVQAFAAIKALYDSPSSYAGKDFIANGRFDIGTRTNGETVELIAFNSGSHDDDGEAEYGVEFVMAEGTTHLNATKGQNIQVKGVIVLGYEDGTTSLDEVSRTKKIVRVYVLAEYMGLLF